MAGINLMNRHMAIAASPHIENQNGSIISTKKALAMPVKSLVVAIEPVQSGSGDPSLDNVRPISGWTGANVCRMGKNLVNISGFTFSKANDKRTDTTTYNIAFPSGTYTLSANISGNGRVYAHATSLNGKVRYGDGILPLTFTTDETHGGFARIYIYMPQNDYDNDKFAEVNNIQLELGSTATAYAPYTGTTYPISWQSEAGTVYGGSLDVTTGLLTVTHKILELDGVTSGKRFGGKSSLATADQYLLNTPDGWTFDADRNRYVTDEEADAYGLRCSVGEYYGTWTVFESKYCYTAYIDPPRLHMRINFLKSMGIDTIAKANEWAAGLYAAGTPCQFIYPIATPQTYQLSPTEVELLLGDNNIWADTGDITMKFWSHNN